MISAAGMFLRRYNAEHRTAEHTSRPHAQSHVPGDGTTGYREYIAMAACPDLPDRLPGGAVRGIPGGRTLPDALTTPGYPGNPAQYPAL